MRNLAISCIAAAAMVGCTTATVTSDPTVRRQAANVRLVTLEERVEFTKRPHTMLKEVVGASCARHYGSNASVDAAREMLRIEAAKMGADAVVDIACEETDVNWKRKCWKSIECRGDAIKSQH